MIAINAQYQKKGQYKSLRADTIQTTPAAANIQAIVYIGEQKVHGKMNKIFRITLNTCTLSQFEAGMNALIAGTTNSYHVGTHEIWKIDYTNNYLYIINNSAQTDWEQAGAAGTATPSGIVDNHIKVAPASIIKNNNGDEIFYMYATDQYFHIDAEDNGSDMLIQVINLDAATAITTVTVKWSLDNVHFVDFPTALASGAIAAGASYGFEIERNAPYSLRIFVDSNDSDYTVIVR